MNQLFYNVYSTIALAEVKGYTMIQFSYMILRIYNNGNVSILELMWWTIIIVAFLLALTTVSAIKVILWFCVVGNFAFESDLARKRFEQQATEKLIAIKCKFWMNQCFYDWL